MSTEEEITHVAFADESHWNIGRYRSLSVVTLRKGDVERIEGELRVLLIDSGVGEFKWEKLRQARDRFAARKFCEYAVRAANTGLLRVDVMEWDIEGNRQQFRKRNDVANLQKMYYCLFLNVLRARWPDDSMWQLYPDEHTALEWASVEDFLDRDSTELVVHQDLLTDGGFQLRLRRQFSIISIQPVSSASQPLVQLADLFAGLCVFSRECFTKYEAWRNTETPRLFDDGISCASLSASDRERCNVLHVFNNACKSRRLGVSLETYKGLRTFNPKNPLNFWWYDPEHPMDKVSTKAKRSA